jgi:GDPmannose 4,6-dehydratase
VIATGETHSVREWIEECFGLLDLEWEKYVETDARYMRPAEEDLLLGDATKARETLHWTPKVTFKALAKMMVEHDLLLAEREKVLKEHDHGRRKV